MANQNADLQGRLSIIDDKNTKFRALITFDIITFDYIELHLILFDD